MRLMLLLDLTINHQLSEVQCNSLGISLTDISAESCKQTRSKALRNDHLVYKQLTGSTSNVHTAYIFIFQNSSCCWEGFLLSCSSTRLCKTPSPTQLFSSICNESLGKPLKNYTSDLPTPRGRWMRYSGLPPHLNTDDSAEKQPWGWRLQSLHPPVPLPPRDTPAAAPCERL